MKTATVTIWSEQGDERVLFAELERYDIEVDGPEEDNKFVAYYVGKLRLDDLDPEDCQDKAAHIMVGRTINIHLPL